MNNMLVKQQQLIKKMKQLIVQQATILQVEGGVVHVAVVERPKNLQLILILSIMALKEQKHVIVFAANHPTSKNNKLDRWNNKQKK